MRFVPLLLATLLLSACGYKTDLTLPEEEARAMPVLSATELRENT